MITADFTHCNDIKTFYQAIRSKHMEAHGAEYVAHHDKINELFHTHGLTSYRELGIMQGATAACAALAGATDLHLIDVDVSRFEPYRHLFDSAVLSLSVEQKSTLSYDSNKLSPCDLLLVDTLHNPDHVQQELNIFSPSTKGFIVIHDTHAIPSIQEMVNRWLKINTQWKLHNYFNQNVGYTTLERIA